MDDPAPKSALWFLFCLKSALWFLFCLILASVTAAREWKFRRGLMTFSDDYRIILSPHGVPDDLDKIIRPDRMLALTAAPELRPHPTYLLWHREHCFKG